MIFLWELLQRTPTGVLILMQKLVGLKCTEQWIRASSNFIALFPTRLTRQILAIFLWNLNSKRLYQSSGKDKESLCLVFTSSTKREIRHFQVVVVQRRQRNVQKSGVIHLQSCCFSNLKTYCFFAVLAAVAVVTDKAWLAGSLRARHHKLDGIIWTKDAYFF